MSEKIIRHNHASLKRVLDHVVATAYDADVLEMGQALLRTIDGCQTHRLVGVSVDNGLPFVGYAKEERYLFDVARRKFAPIDRFYALYVDGDVTQTKRDKLTTAVVAAAKYLGFPVYQAPVAQAKPANECGHW